MGDPGAPPLAGVTVLDFTGNIAGPSATLILRDMGARIVKVEPLEGDVARHWLPLADGVSTVFSAFNRGKESIALDARSPRGREIVLRLAERADVFVESMRPGKAARLGLGARDLRGRNPALIYASVNAFGDVGPLGGLPGFDAIVQAYSGIMDLTGHPDGPPSRVGTAVIDVGSGMWAALAVLGALLQRAADGQGREVETTMLGTAVGFLMHHLAAVRLAGSVPQRLGTAQHNFAPYEAFEAADRPVMVGVSNDGMWGRMRDALDVADDPRFATNDDRVANRAELVAALEAAAAALPAAEVVKRLAASGVPATVVRTVDELAADPQLDALGLWGRTPEGFALARAPVAGAAGDLGAVPACGAHSAAILEEIGLGPEIDALVDEGVVRADGPRLRS